MIKTPWCYAKKKVITNCLQMNLKYFILLKKNQRKTVQISFKNLKRGGHKSKEDKEVSWFFFPIQK